MEYDLNSARLEGALRTLKKQGKLEVEDDLNSAIEEIKLIFDQVEEEESKRKLIYLFIIHTDLPVIQELKDSCIEIFIPDEPTCKINIFLRVLFSIKLENYLYDMITYSPTQVSQEILQSVNKSLLKPTFHKDFYHDDYMFKLLNKIFQRLVNVNNGNLPKHFVSEVITNQFECLLKLLETTLLAALSFSVTDDKVIKFTGHNLLYFFTMINSCFDCFYNEIENFDKDLHSFYIRDIELPKPDDFHFEITNCINLLLNVAEYLVKKISFNLWLLCADIDYKESTLQTKIGEEFYKLLQTINQQKLDVKNEMLDCLQHLVIKPLTEEEIIENSTVESIIVNLQQANNPDQWLRELIKRGEFIHNDDCIIYIINNTNTINDASLAEIFQKGLKLVAETQNLSNLETKKQLLVKVFHNLLIDTKLSNFQIYFDLYYDKLRLEVPNCDLNLFELFNKVVGGNQNDIENLQTKLLTLCIQTPNSVIQNVVQETLSHTNIHLTCNLLAPLKPACVRRHWETTVLVNIIKELLSSTKCPEKDCDVFNRLIVELAIRGLIDPEEFLEHVVSMNICKHIINDEFYLLCFDLEIINKFVDNKLLKELYVWLVLMFDVLRNCGWKPSTFQELKSLVRTTSVNITYKLVSQFIKQHSEEDDTVIQLRSEVNKGVIINHVNFCQLWLHYNQPFPQSHQLHELLLLLIKCEDASSKMLVEYLSRQKHNEVRGMLILALVKLVPVLVSPEVALLTTRLKNVLEQIDVKDLHVYIIDVLSTAMFFITHCLNNQSINYNCYKYIVSNYHTAVNMLWTGDMNKHACLNMFKSVVLFIQVITDYEQREYIAVCLSNMLQRVLGVLDDDVMKEEVLGAVGLINVMKVEQCLIKHC